MAARIASAFACVEGDAGSSRPAGFDLVVDPTPLGMEVDDRRRSTYRNWDLGRPWPIAMERDVTVLASAARARGCRAMPGYEMLPAHLPRYLDSSGLSAGVPAPALQAVQGVVDR